MVISTAKWIDAFRSIVVEESKTSVRTEMVEKDIQISRLKGKVGESECLYYIVLVDRLLSMYYH